MTESKYTIRDSGERVSFESGAMRDTQDDKPRYELIPPGPLKRVADHYANGAKKYADHNWAKGMPTSRFLASLMRHIEQYRQGDTVEDHLAAVVFNAFGIMYFQGTEFDDLFPWGADPKSDENDPESITAPYDEKLEVRSNSPLPCTDEYNKWYQTITIIVNGRPTAVKIALNLPLGTIIPRALSQTSDYGQPVENWELRDSAGVQLSLDKLVNEFHFSPGTQLYLCLRPGIGG